MNMKTRPLILIVDDNPQNLQVLCAILKNAGYRIAAAANGTEALSCVNERIPDLILLDMMMPDINGIEVCSRLKKDLRTSGVPVIFISALSDSYNKVKSFEAGGIDFITKPFEKGEVLMRVKTHLELKLAIDTIKDQNASKDRFFSIVGHDLKAHVSSLVYTAKLFSESMDELEREEIIGLSMEMNKNVTNLHKLLENLLDWAALQRDAMAFNPVSFQLSTLIKDCVHYFSAALEKKNITLAMEIPDHVCAYGDGNMISSLVRNLIANAIKYSYENGRIEISSTLLSTGYIEVSVSDHGTGMDPEAVSKLFRMDEKFSTPGTAGEKGTGLGLLLCRELIERNDGKIHIESKARQGSTFSFTLPAERKPAHAN